MATATKKAHANSRANRRAVAASNSAWMEFLIVEENGGDYHWTLRGRDGNSLARSPSFASYEHAENAAGVVRAGAGLARLDRRAATGSSLDIPEPHLPITAPKAGTVEGRFREATGSRAATPAEARQPPRSTKAHGQRGGRSDP